MRKSNCDILIVSGVLENQDSQHGKKIRYNIGKVKETLKYHYELMRYFHLKIVYIYFLVLSTEKT